MSEMGTQTILYLYKRSKYVNILINSLVQFKYRHNSTLYKPNNRHKIVAMTQPRRVGS